MHRQITSFGYDAFGRVTNKVDAANNLLLVYQYDPDDRVTNRWSVTKGNTAYIYDALGNVTAIHYPVSPAITLKYDALNRLTNLVDAVGTTVYSYDAASQLLSEDGPWASDTVTYTNVNRLRTGMSLLQPGSSAWSQTYAYDSSRRLTNTASTAGGFGYAYDVSRKSAISRLLLPNSAYITNTYDTVARLTGTYLKASANTNLDFNTYVYNLASQRTQTVFTAGNFVNYTYDNAGQLLTAKGREAGGVTNRWQEQFSYGYDGAGNLNLRTNNGLVQAFGLNNLNELTNITRTGTLTVEGFTTALATNVTVNTSNAVLYADTTFAATNFTLSNGTNIFTAIARDSLGDVSTNVVTANLPATNGYAYDLNGNLVTNASQTLAYDDENQLIQVTLTNAWQVQYVYDGKFRRRIEKDFTWSGSAWTQTNEIHFIYDGNTVIQERDTNNNVLVTYTRGGGSLLARTDAGGAAFYHADGNRNITCLIYGNQTIAAHYTYDSFGNPLSVSGPLAYSNTYRFAGKEWDVRTGLYNFARRYYSPSLQRWLNRDPIQELGGLNLYSYVVNDPINLIDLYGFEYQATFGIGGTAGVGAFIGGGVNVGFNSSGQLFIQFQHVEMLGFGAFGGIGLQSGIGHTDCPTALGISTDTAFHIEGNVAEDGSIGAAIDINYENGAGSIPVPKLDIGVGAGGMLGFGRSETTTVSVSLLTVIQAMAQADQSYRAGGW